MKNELRAEIARQKALGWILPTTRRDGDMSARSREVYAALKLALRRLERLGAEETGECPACKELRRLIKKIEA